MAQVSAAVCHLCASAGCTPLPQHHITPITSVLGKAIPVREFDITIKRLSWCCHSIGVLAGSPAGARPSWEVLGFAEIPTLHWGDGLSPPPACRSSPKLRILGLRCGTES